MPSTGVMQLASQHVKVALDGQAADELFAGYHRYDWPRPITFASAA